MSAKNIASIGLQTYLPRSNDKGLFEDQNGYQTYSIFRPEFGVFDNSNTKALTAIFMSRMLYWEGKGTIQKGWILKKGEDWLKEILCSAYQIRTITKNLEIQLLLERKNGAGNVPMYKINWMLVDEKLIEMNTNNEVSIQNIKVPKTAMQRKIVSLFIKGHDKYESYIMTYSTDGKTKGQIISKANKEFLKWEAFIKEAKRNPAENLPKLNGVYLNTPTTKSKVKIKQPELLLTNPVSEVKKKRTSKQTNAKRLQEFTNEYLIIFTEVHKEFHIKKNPNMYYQNPSFEKDGKERNNIRQLVKFIQDKLIASEKNNYTNPVEIPFKEEKQALKAFLKKAAIVSEGWYFNKGFVPSWINSQKSKIFDNFMTGVNNSKASQKSNKLEATEEEIDELLEKSNY
jgi:hypothetical protein